MLTSAGASGWEWQPTDSPAHRLTGVLTWQIPVGRDRAFLSDMPGVLDAIVGGWQYTASGRWYSGRPLFFGAYVVNGNPTLDNPTRDQWFDTSLFGNVPAFTPRTNPSFYDDLDGPDAWFADMTLTKMFSLGPKYRLEARVETYNILNHTVWDNPDLNIANSNFGKVTRKRADSFGREIQLGLRFVF